MFTLLYMKREAILLLPSSKYPMVQKHNASFVAFVLLAVCIPTVQIVAVAQTPRPRIGLETSENLFTVMAGLNACGFDMELSESTPLRITVRQEIAANVANSAEASDARKQLCLYINEKQLPETSRNIAQYISLALNLTPPPSMNPDMKEADLPPDASNVLGILPFLKRFYTATQLHSLWLRHQPEYEHEIARFQAPMTDLVQKTNLYLKLARSGFVEHPFIVYVEPMGAPGLVNARNFSSDYYLVVSPGKVPPDQIVLDTVRHAYLHFVLDDFVLKHPAGVNRLEQLVEMAKSAPLESAYKNDPFLMAVECLIKAIEIRTQTYPKSMSQKDIQSAQDKAVDAMMSQGYILTHTFEHQLEDFEKTSVGMENALSDFLRNVDVDSEHKRIQSTEFAAVAELDPLRRSSHVKSTPLDLAEERIRQGDYVSAARLARESLDQGSDDPAHALYVLARAAVLSKHYEDGRIMFERTLQVAREPRMIAWTHIYLGRIYDVQPEPNREMAVSHYKAALAAGDSSPDTKAAAEKGLTAPPPKVKSKDTDDKN